MLQFGHPALKGAGSHSRELHWVGGKAQDSCALFPAQPLGVSGDESLVS